MPVQPETENDQDADNAKRESNYHTQSASRALRLHCRRQAPLAEKIPDAHAEMKRRGKNPHDHERKRIRTLQELLNVRVGGFPVGEPALGIEMPADVDERDQARVTLRGVEPVRNPRIRGYIRLSAQPDVNAVAAMKE